MKIDLATPLHCEDACMLQTHQPGLFDLEERLRQLRQEGDPLVRRGKAIDWGIIPFASEIRSRFRDLIFSREAAKSRRGAGEKRGGQKHSGSNNCASREGRVTWLQFILRAFA